MQSVPPPTPQSEDHPSSAGTAWGKPRARRAPKDGLLTFHLKGIGKAIASEAVQPFLWPLRCR